MKAIARRHSCVIAAAFAAVAFPATASEIVVAKKVTNPPELSAGTDDPAWTKANVVSVSLAGGANFPGGGTTATVRAVRSGDTLFMLIQYDDATLSARRVPYQKQADGSWQKLRDPNDMGGDENEYYEDKLALVWNIGGSTGNFSQLGCMTSCHAGEPGKPYGNKYTSSAGELGDIWHAKSVRTGPVGQIDDQYLDDTRYDKEQSPGAGRKSDPKTGGGYANIELVDGKPEFMDPRAIPANREGGSYFVRDEEKAPFDDSKFNPGDEVASILIAPFSGDRGDITASMDWESGKWTVVIARKLVTGSDYDVQFDDLSGTYEFGLAAFDNAQVRHAVHIGAIRLQFAD